MSGPSTPVATVADVRRRLRAADTAGAVDRLVAFSDGDPVLLCALAFTALGLDEPTRDRLLIEALAQPRPPSGPALTPRQQQILELLGDGLTVVAIARRLRLSPRTVGKHLELLYRRLGTSDRLMTVIHAQRHGLLGATR
ncbi:helix-turn-helix transcriptional regulator [Actinophytocola sediminis]